MTWCPVAAMDAAALAVARDPTASDDDRAAARQHLLETCDLGRLSPSQMVLMDLILATAFDEEPPTTDDVRRALEAELDALA